MKNTGSRRQLTHERILDVAARTLRKAGFHGIGVSDVMKQAGLTHGGFYAHFQSRDALLVEALEAADRDSRESLESALFSAEATNVSQFRALVESYLSEHHLKNPGSGCPVAALISDMPRQSVPVRKAAVRRVDSLLASVEAVLPAGLPVEMAAVVTGQLIGALQIARALGNNVRGIHHLATVRHFLIDEFDPQPPSTP